MARYRASGRDEKDNGWAVIAEGPGEAFRVIAYHLTRADAEHLTAALNAFDPQPAHPAPSGGVSSTVNPEAK